MKNKKSVLPVLKASSQKLFALIRCVYNHPFDRDGLRDAVLELYPGRDEKSVFRGMVIPTLRRLGLIIGYEQSIRLSANGMLLFTAHNNSESEGLRALRAILLEMDQNTGRFVEQLEQSGSMVMKRFSDQQVSKIEGPNKKQSLERTRDWVAYLSYAGIVRARGDYLDINLDNLQQARIDLDVNSKINFFVHFLFSRYKELVYHQSGIRSVVIEDLRQEVAVSVYKDKSAIITETQFDILLRRVPYITAEYAITFGRSMGSEEKLFISDDKYYETISIRFDGRQST